MIYGFTFYINEIKEPLSMNPGVNNQEITPILYVNEAKQTAAPNPVPARQTADPRMSPLTRGAAPS